MGLQYVQYHNLSLEDVLQQILSRNVYISETLPLFMSKNTIDSITEQEDNAESSASLSSDVGDPLQDVTTLQTESLGINEMSTHAPSNGDEELDELSSTSQPTNGGKDIGASSVEGKSQLRNFLSVAKAKWDNVPQGWMQQRTNQGD